MNNNLNLRTMFLLLKFVYNSINIEDSVFDQQGKKNMLVHSTIKTSSEM